MPGSWRRWAGLPLSLMTLVLLLASCAGAHAPPIKGPLVPDSGRHDSGSLTGAGSTFAAILYQAWFYNYNKDVAPGVKINYQSIGSGAGIQQFIAGLVDFGATDAPMTDADLRRAPDAQHIPTVIGAVVLTYNLPGLTAPLHLDGQTTAAIYLGQIRRWDDPSIKALNPGANLPDAAIQVVHRSDGSGTTFVLTDWLSKVSDTWKTSVGATKNPNWPIGLGGKGNEGVTQLVSQTPGAIGYLEWNYAATNKLPVAMVRNSAGTFVAPTLDSVSAAGTGIKLPSDYRVSITNPPDARAYPIASFTFILLHRTVTACQQDRVLLHALWWALHAPSAVQTTRDLLYAPLPPDVLQRVDATLHSITCNGKPVLEATAPAT